MNNKTSSLLISIFILVFAPSFVLGQIIEDIANKAAEAAFSEAERQVIEKYYTVTAPIQGEVYEENDNDDNSKSVGKKNDKGKGNSKRSELPKGIAMKLERGGTLPPGHAKRYLSSDLERQLPKPPEGYERIESDGKVILRNIASGIISDVINIVTNPNAKVSNEQPTVNDNTPEENQAPDNSDSNWWQFWKN